MYLNINLKWKGSFKTRSKWAFKQHKFGNVISDSLEFGWVTSRLKVHRESSINLNWNCSVEAGSFIFKAIQNHRQKRWNMRFGVLLFCNSTSDCLETAWVSSWGSGMSIWIEIVLWKQGLLFLEPFKITDRRRGIWDLESFYYIIQHQIVLKLLECQHGVVDCQSELKLICGSRDFNFYSHSKSQTEDVEYEIWSAFIL